MTKQDIINEVSQSTRIDKHICDAVICSAVNTARKAILRNEPIYIRGLFTVKNIIRRDKPARIISKGTSILIPAHYAPHAKFSKELKDRVAKIKCVEN